MTEAVSHDRTKNYFRQVKGSALFKGLAVAASFFAIPLMIRYLGQEQYGIWSTLLSIMSWVVFFDLGIGNGLRNKVAESLAKNQVSKAAGYISSGYTWIGAISLVLFVLVAIMSFIIPWQTVFNTRMLTEETLRNAVLIAVFFILLNFWIGLINQVLNAVQKTSWVVFGQFLASVLSLIVVFILTKTTDVSLLYLVTGYGLAMVAASLLLSVGYYTIRSDLIPRVSFEKQHINPLLSLGLQFFSIQLAVLVIFTTDKILITQLFGPQYVIQYDVVFKLFSAITMVHSLITAPLWSAYTDAYHRDDYAWIKAVLRKQLWIFVGIVLATIMLAFAAKLIIELWIGKDVEVSGLLILSMGVFVVVSVWNNIFGYILGGINKIRLGSVYTVATAVLNIPISYYFAIKLDMGVSGIMMGTVASILISAILSPLQVYYFIYTKRNNKLLSSILR